MPVIPSRTNPLVPPGRGPVLPSTPVKTTDVPPTPPTNAPTTTVKTSRSVGVPKKRSITDLITHLAKSDNHLWQALDSLQSQTNEIVGNATDWTGWNPKISSWDPSVPDYEGKPITNSELSAYYMTMGKILFIELYGQLTFVDPVIYLQVSLPLNVGGTVIRTFSSYLYQTYNQNTGTAPIHNGVTGAEARGQMAKIIIDPTFMVIPGSGGLICNFMMGGALGIIQGS